jgi:AbrB family looped-hinge helix DNA binding protein
MKHNFNSPMRKGMHEQDKLYGTTTLGARGQLVIPIDARKDLNLNPGDQLLVMGKFGKVLGLMKADQLGEFIETIMKHVAGTSREKEIKNHIEKVFGVFALKNKKQL